MNFFFSFKFNNINNNLNIPLFSNEKNLPENVYIFSAKVNDNSQWDIKKANYELKNNFAILDSQSLNNEEIYFIATDKEVSSNKEILKNKLFNLNKYTDTVPSYRANLKIYLDNKGFSSYQAEYPLDMTFKKGSIISPISTLLNDQAEENYLIFKNIYYLPKKEVFKLSVLDIKKKKVLKEFNVFSNFSNVIKIDKQFIKKNNYIFTEQLIGIPIYVSINNGHISMEHTHPPHLYLWGDDKFNIIKKFKDNIFNETINK